MQSASGKVGLDLGLICNPPQGKEDLLDTAVGEWKVKYTSSQSRSTFSHFCESGQVCAL